MRITKSVMRLAVFNYLTWLLLLSMMLVYLATLEGGVMSVLILMFSFATFAIFLMLLHQLALVGDLYQDVLISVRELWGQGCGKTHLMSQQLIQYLDNREVMRCHCWCLLGYGITSDMVKYATVIIGTYLLLQLAYRL